jgi:2'-5' RNA ligase
MVSQYSIVITPPDDVADTVKSMKMELYRLLGWFNSKNSKAHITICNFWADGEFEIPKIKQHLQQLCNTASGLKLSLDSVEKYVNGAVCILPNADCRNDLIKLMKRISCDFKSSCTYKSASPHMSIARRLGQENAALALHLFCTIPKISFYCDRITLRVFNGRMKQYETVEEFQFRNGTDPSGQQLRLF